MRVGRTAGILAALLVVAGCGSHEAGRVEAGGVWTLVPPAREHVDGRRLDAADRWARTRVPSLTALLVARHGRLVFERYYHLGLANQPAPLYSVTKSVVSTLVGIALGEGKLKTLDLRVGDVLADTIPAGADPRVRSITLRELLTMSAGLSFGQADPTGEGGGTYRTTPDWVRTILGSALAGDPGTRFSYDNGDAHLVSAILQRVIGTTAAGFARKELFRPLRINVVRWSADRQGITDSAVGLELSPRDLAKLGELYLRGGRWGGRQLVPAAYIRAATSPHISAAQAGPGRANLAALGYGYFWWTYPDQKIRCLRRLRETPGCFGCGT
jgi:CubicO group peptidase (beta-lactamase class C family)